MNETPGKPPYEELPDIDIHCRHTLTNGWCYPRDASSLVSSGYRPPHVGPGNFPLYFRVHEMIKAIEVWYRFKMGSEAEIQAAEEGAPVYRISAPDGRVIIPVGAVREWIVRLPAGTSVHAYIDKWQLDAEKMARRPKPVITPEDMERAKKQIAEWKESRKR